MRLVRLLMIAVVPLALALGGPWRPGDRGSVVGQGTIFTLTVPLEGQESAQA